MSNGTPITQPLVGHTNSYHTYGFAEALDGIGNAGFGCIELSAIEGWTEHVDLERDPPADVRRILDEHGLTAVSLSAHSDLTTPDGLRYAQRAVDWAAGYGLGIVNTAIGGHASSEESEAAFLKNIGALADAAQASGIVIALETHGELMATGKQTLELVEKISRDSIKVNYDTANVMYYGGVRAEDDLPSIVSFVAHVHLKDTVGGREVWNFPAIGSGALDFGRILEILDDAGYRGPLSVELEFQGEPWPSLAKVNESMQRSHEHLKRLGLR